MDGEGMSQMVQAIAVPVTVLCVAAAGWWMRGSKRKEQRLSGSKEDSTKNESERTETPVADLKESEHQQKGDETKEKKSEDYVRDVDDVTSASPPTETQKDDTAPITEVSDEVVDDGPEISVVEESREVQVVAEEESPDVPAPVDVAEGGNDVEELETTPGSSLTTALPDSEAVEAENLTSDNAIEGEGTDLQDVQPREESEKKAAEADGVLDDVQAAPRGEQPEAVSVPAPVPAHGGFASEQEEQLQPEQDAELASTDRPDVEQQETIEEEETEDNVVDEAPAVIEAVADEEPSPATAPESFASAQLEHATSESHEDAPGVEYQLSTNTSVEDTASDQEMHETTSVDASTTYEEHEEVAPLSSGPKLEVRFAHRYSDSNVSTDMSADGFDGTDDTNCSVQGADELALTPPFRPSEEELLNMFRQQIRDRVKLHRHFGKYTEEVLIKVKNRKLAIKTGLLKRTSAIISLRDVTEVLIGKQTEIFQTTNAPRLEESLCFSLVVRDGTTFDFEASSELERDMLVAGFLRVLDSYRNPQRRFTLSSNASLQTISSEGTEDT